MIVILTETIIIIIKARNQVKMKGILRKSHNLSTRLRGPGFLNGTKPFKIFDYMIMCLLVYVYNKSNIKDISYLVNLRYL